MKTVLKTIVLLLMLCTFRSAFSQNYSLNNGFYNGASVTTCSGTFFDSNPTGTYSSDEGYTVTFCSGSPGKVIQIIFSNINIASGDTLYAFDGTSVNDQAIDTFTGITSTFQYITPSVTNFSGCITFRFVSNSTVETDGWIGQIRCIYPCNQRILASALSAPVQDANGYTNICFGDTVGLGVQTVYPDNNISYHQDDSSSVFHWSFGDGKDSIGKNLVSVKHQYIKNGGYYARLTITDSNGCTANLPIRFPIRSGIKPVYRIAVPPNICLFDTLVLAPVSSVGITGSLDMPIGTFFSLPESGDSVFLPDDPPKCFTSSIPVDQFAQGQKLNSINDLKGIFINMEHSYLGDITISLTAPNGTTVILKNVVGGTALDGTFIGEPVDETLNGGTYNPALVNVIGKGYEYVFNNAPQYGTMWSEASKYTYNFTDNAGRQVVGHYYLPAGSYTSEQNLSALIGTQLNGNWTLQICDKQAQDNGFLFNWKIEFNQAIIPSSVQYTVPIISQTWLPATGIISTNNATAIVSPALPGNYTYRFRVVDTFGCTYDTLVKVANKPLPQKPRLGGDKKICIGEPTSITVANPNAQQMYMWSNFLTATSITIDQPDIYWVKTTDTNGCSNADTVNITPKLPFRISLGNDTSFCASKPNVLQPQSANGIVEWHWNTGDTTAAITISAPGNYWLQGKNTGGCWVRDSIVIDYNPVNLFNLPGDTSICDRTGYQLTLQPPANTSITWQNGQTGNSLFVSCGQSYSITANNKGCLAYSSIKVNAKPLPIFNLGNDTTLCIGYELPLHAAYPGAYYKWSTGSSESFIVAKTKGLYWAEATYNGCVYRDSIQFSQKRCDCDIEMPNAFSPNGDGVNDTYRPYIKCYPRSYQLTIFNRYGQQVFYSKDYRALWDGKVNGNSAPIGTYYYILTFRNDEMMREEKRTGNITVLR